MAAWKKRSRSVRADKTRFVDYDCGPLRGTCIKGYETLDLTAIPWDALRHRRDPNHKLAKKSRTRRVVRLDFAPGGGPKRGVYAKRVRVLDRRKRLGALLSSSKTRHEWIAGHRLLAMGIPTCRPVIFAEQWEGHRLRACYLVTEELTDARPIRDEFEMCRTKRPRRRQLLVQLAQWLWQIHRRGFYHDDCSAEHVFVGPAAAGDSLTESPGRFLLIDLDNCRFHWLTVPWGRRMKNLFQLLRSIPPHLATRTDRLHFVLAYLAASGEQRRLRRAVVHMRRLARKKETKIHL